MRRVLVTLLIAVGLLVAGQGAVAAQPADTPTPTEGETLTLTEPGLILTNDEPARGPGGGDDDDEDRSCTAPCPV